MRDGGGDGARAALVVEIAACRRGQAAQVIMMVMVIEGMDGVSTNHSCERTQIIERHGLDLAHKSYGIKASSMVRLEHLLMQNKEQHRLKDMKYVAGVKN